MIRLSARWAIKVDRLNYTLVETVIATKSGKERESLFGHYPNLDQLGRAIVECEIAEAAGVVEDLQSLRSIALESMVRLFESIDIPEPKDLKK